MEEDTRVLVEKAKAWADLKDAINEGAEDKVDDLLAAEEALYEAARAL